MTKDEIKKALACCAGNIDWLDCNDCPYFKHHCGRGNKLMQDALDLITEKEKDYSKLQEMFANYQLASDKEIRAQVKQAQIDVLNKVINYINNKIENDYGDMSDSVNYLTINIDDFDDFIDELIKGVENE